MQGKQVPQPWNEPTLVPQTFQAGGALGLDALYVERRADTQLFDVLRQGNLCHVLAPRQLGKSSLLLRTKDKLLRQGWLCVDLDLQIFATDSEHQFYAGGMDRLARELGLYWDASKFRQRHLESPLSYLWVSFLIDHLLPARRKNLAIFVDDTDILKSRPFGASEFLFGLRNAIERSGEMSAPSGAQRALFSVCLSGVAQPIEPTRDSRGSLVEISRAIDLVDFTADETRQLLPALSRLSLYDLPQLWLDAVLEWTGGHPYLTQKLCADLADAAPAPPRGFRPNTAAGRGM